MDDLDLNKILLSQGDPMSLYEPEEYTDKSLEHFSTKVSRIGEHEFNIETSLGPQFKYFTDEETSSHLRHDYVAGATWGGTDESLQKLGIDSILTPDCIQVETKKVLELSTSFSGRRETLNGQFIRKRVAYESILQKHAIKYYIIVVSRDSILSNCKLADSIVSKLCQRCRCGMSLVAQIEKMTGKVIQDREGARTKGVRQTQKTLGEAAMWDRKSSIDLSPVLKDLGNSNPSEEDKDWIKSIMSKCMSKSHYRSKELRSGDSSSRLSCVLDEYRKELRFESTRQDEKRVNIFPMIVTQDVKWNERRQLNVIGENVNCPSSIYNLWKGVTESRTWSDQRDYIRIKQESKNEARSSSIKEGVHKIRHRSTFYPQLNSSQLDHIALSGPGAKMRREIHEVSEHYQHSKKSFDLNASTEDINTFIHSDVLTGQEHEGMVDDTILELICKSKNDYHPDAESINVFKWFRGNSISQHASMISEICTELSYEYKVPHKPGAWGIKLCRTMPVMILFRCTGTHVFFSLAFDKRYSDIVEPGKIGPELWETQNYIMTDFSSISEEGLNHFVKSLPYILSLQASLYQIWGLPLPQKHVTEPDSYWQCLKTIYILYLNNKLDSEETVTSVRYLYMNLFQESFRDLSVFVDRLPRVLRSRLTVYLVNKIISILQYYSTTGVRRIKLRDTRGVSKYKLHTVKNIFCNSDFNSTQLINSFYFGYVVSKTKGRISDRDIKTVKKIVEEEFWYIDNIVKKGVVLWGRRDKPLKHCWDPTLVSYMIHNHFEQLNGVYGGGFSELLEQDVIDSISRGSFIEIATLKASSHDEEVEFYVPNAEHFDSYKELKKELLRGNPSQKGKRPRVITKLFETVSKYMFESGNSSPSVCEVAVWCLKKLHDKGYFVADIFPKDQHGGDREIHVLHIQARMSQFIIERMARVICSYFPHDSIVHPSWKNKYYQDHQKRSTSKLGEHMTICKSADAAKWCQRNSSSQFYFIMKSYLPSYMEPFLYAFFYLWTRKRIQMPSSITANFLANRTTESSNKFYTEFRHRFYNSCEPFPDKKSRNTMTIRAGMWQGILHITSTLKHSLIQNFWKSYTESLLSKSGISAVVDVIQGSDDSAALISTNDRRKSTFIAIEKILMMKEYLCEYYSIWYSEAKCSIGTINLVEYNSEWIIDNNVVKPTLRWSLACLETTLVERFVTRLQIYYGTLQQTLESGGATFLCSILQMCQAYMHYMLLGVRNSLLDKEVSELIHDSKHPAVGFFPLDSDLNAGLTGLDYLLYDTYRRFNVDIHCYAMEEMSPQSRLEYEGKLESTVKRDISSIKIPFSDYRIWNKIVEEMGIPTLEGLVRTVEENPRNLYIPSRSWDDQKTICSLKLFQPGVVASLSAHQSNVRMMAASSYIITRPCISAKRLGHEGKLSLYSILSQSGKYFSDSSKFVSKDTFFPNQDEYSEFYDYKEDLISSYFYQIADMRRTGKTEVPIWGGQSMSDIPILDICIRAWWSYKSVKISSTMFEELWRQTKAKYPFLRESESETRQATDMNSMELYNFLSSISSKTRKLVLQDVQAKGNNKESIISRVFWPDVKVRSDTATTLTEVQQLRHYIFSVLTYPATLSWKRENVIDKLRNSIMLSRRFNDLPRNARRLKIFRDFIVTGNLMQLITQVENIKKGCIGFFSTRQHYIHEGRERKPEGPGEWNGKVCGVGCAIRASGKYVDEIRLERLTDLLELSKTLKALMIELKYEFPEIPDKSRSSLYLTSKGVFESDYRIVHNSCCVVVDKHCRIDVFDAMGDYDWKLKIAENRLRLVCELEYKEFGKRDMTILSDTFTSRDWDPILEPEHSEDEMLVRWQKGLPWSLESIVKSFNGDLSEQSIRRILNRLELSDSYTNGKLNLKRLRDLIFSDLQERLVGERKFMEAEIADRLSHDVELSGDDLKLFAELCELEDPDVDIINKMEEYTSEELVEDTSSTSDSLYASPEISEKIREDVMDRLQDMFFSDDKESTPQLAKEILGGLSMPLSHMFTSNILSWMDDEGITDEFRKYFLGAKSRESLFEEVRLPSELRTILSIVLGQVFKDKYSDLRSEELDKVGVRQASMSSFTEDFLITKSSSDLQVSIEEIDKIMPSISGELRRKMEALRQKYKAELDAVNTMGEHHILGHVPYWLFIDKLIRKLKSEGFWSREIPEGNLLTYRTMLIADCLDQCAVQVRSRIMAESMFSEVVATAWSEVVSMGLIKAISQGLRIELTVQLDGELVASHRHPLAIKELKLHFRVKDLSKLDPTSSFGKI